MTLNESIVEDAAIASFLLRQGFRFHQGFGGQVGALVSRLREVGHGGAFAQLRQAKPCLASGESAVERGSSVEVVQLR